MQTNTYKKFTEYHHDLAIVNQADPSANIFNVLPAVEEKLEKQVSEKSDFLSKINVVPVKEIKGKKLQLGLNGSLLSTTNTSEKARTTKSLHNFTDTEYECKKVNFDRHTTYDQLDMWASKHNNFKQFLRDLYFEQIAKDRITVGFNGKIYAENSDVNLNPLLQDCGVGWLQQVRDNVPENFLKDVTIGNGGNYQNIDQAVFDVRNSLIDKKYADDLNLVVICGRDILKDKYYALFNNTEAPTERQALQTILLNSTIGGLKAVVVPQFPSKSFLVTSFDNLSIYYQKQSKRISIKDNPERDRIEEYLTSRECYVVENFEKIALCENVQFSDGKGGWA